jgi:UDP-2,3-diacylglucosamine pyrophosphatase LpxH
MVISHTVAIPDDMRVTSAAAWNFRALTIVKVNPAPSCHRTAKQIRHRLAHVDGTTSSLIVLAQPSNRRFRALFISDVHLGSRGAQADLLLDFLRYHEADTIYLVGDIVDGWQLKSAWYWPQAHNDVVQKFLRQARKGVPIIYVPGNHDEFLRDYYGTHFGGIEVVETVIHDGADGRRYLVIHGDHFDLVVTQARWLALLGSKAYDWAIATNRIFNAIRRRLGFGYWSLSQWAKLKVKNAVNYIGEFEKTLASEAHRREVDGVICGHIHHAAMRDLDGVRYLNCGDWVESCTAIVEHFDGRFEIIVWSDDARQKALLEGEPPAAPAGRPVSAAA